MLARPRCGGWVAEIEPDSFPDLRFQALNLSLGLCRTGVHDAGSAIAKTGVSGLGQVMPDNLVPQDAYGNEITNSGWDFEALGHDLTPERFLSDADAQSQIINHQLSKIYDVQIAAGKSEDDAIRRTAAAWYSGDPNKASDDTPQNWEGDPSKAYPSIQDYSDDVLERMAQMNDANSDPSSTLAEKIEEKKRQKAAFDLHQERLKQLDK